MHFSLATAALLVSLLLGWSDMLSAQNRQPVSPSPGDGQTLVSPPLNPLPGTQSTSDPQLIDQQRHQNVTQTNAAMAQIYRWYAAVDCGLSLTALESDEAVVSDPSWIARQLSGSPSELVPGICRQQHQVRWFQLRAYQQQRTVINVGVDYLDKLSGRRLTMEQQFYLQDRAASLPLIRRVDVLHRRPLKSYSAVNPQALSYETLSSQNRNPQNLSSQNRNPQNLSSQSRGPQQPMNRIRSLVHYWVSLLDYLSEPPESLGNIFASQPLQLHFVGVDINNQQKLFDWLASRQRRAQRGSHIVDRLKIRAIGGSRYRVSFELDWRGVSAEGLIEIARIEVIWLVEERQLEFPQVLRADERYLSPLMDTGSRISC